MVPGPSKTVYLAGFELLANHPAPILGSGRFLNVTLRRYRDQLDLGIMTDPEQIAEVAADKRKIVVNTSDIRIDHQRRLMGLSGFLVLANGAQGIAEIGKRTGVIWIKHGASPKGARGRREAVGRPQCDP